jgi:putative phosphoesterase
MSSTATPTDRVDARRIGLVADTHSRAADGSDLPDGVLAALSGVDLVIHLGDMGAVGSLDRFATVAPVLATKGGHAVGRDARIADPVRLIETGRFHVGALFELPKLAPEFQVKEDGTLVFPDGPIAPALERAFGRRVDVVAFAATHAPFVGERDGVLFVNPGSPNLPAKPPGSVAIVDLTGARPSAAIREVRA